MVYSLYVVDQSKNENMMTMTMVIMNFDVGFFVFFCVFFHLFVLLMMHIKAVSLLKRLKRERNKKM